MRKTILFACAAVLTSAVALTSCKKDGQNEPKKPAEVVKTEFAIAIPEQASNGVRRMPGTTVPADGVFKGMKNIALIPFAKTSAIESSDVRLGGENISGITDIPASGGGTLTTTGNAKVYSNISIPLTTASFLVYGEASNAAAAGGSDEAKHENGYLAATGITAGAPAGIHFDLAPVLGATTLDGVYTDAKAVALLGLLNGVANATDGAGTPKAWKAYQAGDDPGMVAMWETYKTMHALSSFEVLRVLSDLYKSVEPLKAASDPVATLAANIQTAIEDGITVTGSAPDDFTFALKTSPTNLNGFPTNLNLPDGAVRIKYVGESTNAFMPCVAGDYDTQTDPTLFVYPTSLWYYANSTIKTANKSMSGQYIDGKTWGEIITAYTDEAKPAAVNSETRSVAIANQIQYAVGRLDVQVKLNTNVLKDNVEQDITAHVDGFPVSAVFIGNQRQLNFDFTPIVSPSTLYTIYDNALTGIVADEAGYSAVNSTLVLETPATGGDIADSNADVQIAIELTNNSQTGDFIGANGQLIPAGGKFYLVATLNAKDATEANAGKRVFRQDVQTIAKLNITNLRNAYNEIPDLRTPQLELGMSVDLSWKSGHTYDVNL